MHERRELHCVVTGWPAARIHRVRIYNPRGEVGAAGIFSSYQSASPNCRPSPHAFLVRLGHSGNTSFAFVRQQALPGSFQAHFHSGRVSVYGSGALLVGAPYVASIPGGRDRDATASGAYRLCGIVLEHVLSRSFT